MHLFIDLITVVAMNSQILFMFCNVPRVLDAAASCVIENLFMSEWLMFSLVRIHGRI